MKFIRYAKGLPQYRGILDGENIKRINGTIFHDYAVTNDVEHISNIQILPPVIPSKIIGFRKNYYGDRNEIGTPKIFMKGQNTIAAHNENIIIPANLDKVNIEGELAVIIGKKAKNISENHFAHYILGYTIANDVTSPSDSIDQNVTIGKFYDSFTPLGPVINTDINIEDLKIKTYINNELCQNGSTKDMIFDIPYQIAYLSSIMTLNPGDVILTGTPGSACPVKHNDNISIEIENIGVLSNKVVKEGVNG